jgi:16S rRNA (guanine(966)-N(2))-methyltransferase RsmD
MRITGGLYRSRKVQCPPGVIRPAMDRMRESMFSILGNISGLSFLDLFSGSGVVGIEAASRGAGSVLLVEIDRRKIPVMKKNISFVESPISIRIGSAESALERPDKKYDIIYMDPPFDYVEKKELLRLAAEGGAMEEEGLCIIHHPTREELPDRLSRFERVDQRRYGGSSLSFYRSPKA